MDLQIWAEQSNAEAISQATDTEMHARQTIFSAVLREHIFWGQIKDDNVVVMHDNTKCSLFPKQNADEFAGQCHG